MNDSNLTFKLLCDALNRIVTGKPLLVDPNRKLSIRAVEEEAGLGNGTAYYYPDFINKFKLEKLKKIKANDPESLSSLERSEQKRINEKRIKLKYKAQIQELKSSLSKMAAEHHQLSHALHAAITENERLVSENLKLKSIKIKPIK